jgi:AcrR family transcriptional regulator
MVETDNQKYLQIIRTARELFWKYGIKRVTIEEICKVGRVSKATFYKHFANKNELVKRLIDRVMDEGMAKYREIMEQDIPFEEKVKQTIQLRLEQTESMSQEFFSDYLLQGVEGLSGYLHKKADEGIAIILGDYIRAQERGEIRQDIRPEFIMYFLNHMVNIAKDKQLLKLYGQPSDLINEMVRFFFYGIMPRKKRE